MQRTLVAHRLPDSASLVIQLCVRLASLDMPLALALCWHCPSYFCEYPCPSALLESIF